MVKAVTQTAPDAEIGWSRRRHASRRRSGGVRHRRTPEGEGGPNGPTGFLTLPGEEWSSPEIRPRNLNMIECERRPNGTRNEHQRSGGQQQKQKNLEKSCRGLIFGERLTEEKLD